MKIVIITDTHFGARNDNNNFNEYFYKFYEEQFFPYLKENNIKLYWSDVSISDNNYFTRGGRVVSMVNYNTKLFIETFKNPTSL